MTEMKSCERLRLYTSSSLIRNLSNDIFFPCLPRHVSAYRSKSLFEFSLIAPFSPKETEPVRLPSPRREKWDANFSFLAFDSLNYTFKKKKENSARSRIDILFTSWSSARFLNNASASILTVDFTIESWLQACFTVPIIMMRKKKKGGKKRKKNQ